MRKVGVASTVRKRIVGCGRRMGERKKRKKQGREKPPGLRAAPHTRTGSEGGIVNAPAQALGTLLQTFEGQSYRLERLTMLCSGFGYNAVLLLFPCATATCRSTLGLKDKHYRPISLWLPAKLTFRDSSVRLMSPLMQPYSILPRLFSHHQSPKVNYYSIRGTVFHVAPSLSLVIITDCT